MKVKESKPGFFKSSEEIISMFLGLLIVVLVVSLIANYFQRNRGKIDLPGISDNVKNSETISQQNEVVNNETYEVKRGDNLWKISLEKLGNGDRWTEIAKLNNLANPRILIAGQSLKMPVLDSVTAIKSETNNNYVVKAGDNLWKISVQLYGDGYQWLKIYRANVNLIKNPNKIEVGMKLSV